MEVSPATFAAVLLAARIPRYFIIAWLGTRLGPQTLPFLKAHIGALVLIAVVLCVLLFAIVHVAGRDRSVEP